MRNVQVIECRCINSLIGPAILEDSIIDTLKINDLLIFEGTLFKHVVFRGSIGSTKIIPRAGFVDLTPAIQSQFDRQRLALYEKTDWALDIAESKFVNFEVSGIPPRLVRRDTKSQVVVKQVNVERAGWRRKLASWNTFWPTVLNMRMGGSEDEFILVAQKGKKGFKKLVDGLNQLRDLGVAEPD